MIADLFAGAGGVSQGLRLAGRTDVVGVENNVAAVATARRAGHERIIADVYGFNPRKLLDLAGPAGVEGLHGSPPCGGLSKSGLGFGRDDLGRVVDLLDCLADGEDHRADFLLDWQDLRSPLMAEPMRYLLALAPAWLTLEQVPEAVFVWEEYAAHLSAAGWFVDVGVVNARWFGVPQDRERAILLAHRTRPVVVPAGPLVDEVPASSVVGPGRLGFPRRNDRPDGGAYRARDMRSTGLPSFTVTEKARSWTLDPCTHDVALRPAPAGRRLPDVVRACDCRPRPLTVAEVGQLQGFPADYPWPEGDGDRTVACLQAANAVPPPMYAGLVAPLLGLDPVTVLRGAA